MADVEITRKGEWPILKYTMRSKNFGYCVVMIDDDYGDVLINPGDQIALLHWWGKDGRGKGKLREFLCRDSRSYMTDKFSYGLDRWSYDLAVKEVIAKITEKFGKRDDWDEEIEDVVSQVEDGPMSRDLFQFKLMGSDMLVEDDFLFHECSGVGETEGNREVMHFMKTKWPHLVEFWKKELAEEAASVEATV